MLKKLISRNIKLYFRNKTSVFFSLLSVLIVIILYVLFLSNVQVESVGKQLNGAVSDGDISYLINSWVLAGMLSITTVTSTLGALGFMVDDREKKIIIDFKSAPLKISTYPIAGVISAMVVGIIISVITFMLYGMYIFIDTGYYFSLIIILRTLGLIVISTFMSAALMGLLVSFFSTNSTFSSASLLIGTTIGFVNGLYIPVGQLSNTIQKSLNLLPFSHIASLFRQVIMKDSIALSFADAPLDATNNYKETFGVVLKWGETSINYNFSMIFIILVFIISLTLFFANFKRKRQVI